MTRIKQAQNSIPELCDLISLVKQASKQIISRDRVSLETDLKRDGGLVTEVDEGMQALLKDQLESRWPNYGFIGEEMTYDDQVRVCEEYESGYWVLDPLDGTTNFISGFLFFGVSLALVINGSPVLAVIYDPVRDECFSAQKGCGAYLNGQRLKTPSTDSLDNCIANIDYKRLVGDLSSQLVRCPPYRSQRNLGSSVLEWCWLASGRIQLYLHGGQKLWDFAAGYLILLEAGGAATSLSGLPLDCTNLRKRSVVAAVNAGLLEKWEKWIDDNSQISQSAPF
jgi:myo-inositol-1(or 4)-monophosphatase